MADRVVNIDGLAVSVPESWIVDDRADEITLWRSPDGGAIVISTYRHADPMRQANALEKCRRFLASLGADPDGARGSVADACAEFTDNDGVAWMVRTFTRGPRFALATYNSAEASAAQDESPTTEKREMRRVLRSLTWTAGNSTG